MNVAPGNRWDVLVVDDDADALEEMHDALANADLRVLTASGAAAALQLLRENEVSVVVTDVRMPDITGMMLASLLREEFKANAPALIFISGYAERDTVIESIRHAPSGFLLKPIDTQELLLAVFRALGAHNATRAAEPARGAGAPPPAAAGAPPDLVLELLQLERQVRERLFHADVAQTPAWQLILDLYRVEKQGGHNYVSSVALSSGLPLTTALRYIDQLVGCGYVERARDTADARRVRVSLTPQCIALLQRYTEEVARESAGFGAAQA